MLKRLLTASCAAALMTGAASAADLPRRAAPPPFVPVPIFTWTGFYFGVNAGYAFGGDQRFATRAIDPLDPVTPVYISALGLNSARRSQDGFTGGGQVGYNYQFTPGNSFVVGVEADAAYTDLGSRSRRSADLVDPNNALVINLDNTTSNNLQFLGTVRGRLGYAFDRFMVYGTGGFAYGLTDFNSRTNIGLTIAGFPTGPIERISGGYNDRFSTGYAYGGGIEYALPTDSFLNFFRSSAVTLKVEYLHYDLGSRNVVGFNNLIPAVGPDVRVTTTRVKTEGDIVRAGLNFKFGSY